MCHKKGCSDYFFRKRPSMLIQTPRICQIFSPSILIDIRWPFCKITFLILDFEKKGSSFILFSSIRFDNSVWECWHKPGWTSDPALHMRFALKEWEGRLVFYTHISMFRTDQTSSDPSSHSNSTLRFLIISLDFKKDFDHQLE